MGRFYRTFPAMDFSNASRLTGGQAQGIPRGVYYSFSPVPKVPRTCFCAFPPILQQVCSDSITLFLDAFSPLGHLFLEGILEDGGSFLPALMTPVHRE